MSSTKGRDTIGRGHAHGIHGNVVQGKRPIEFGSQSNTVSGHNKHVGPDEVGTRCVGDKMLGAEREQPNPTVGRGVKFEIGENQAKKIEHA